MKKKNAHWNRKCAIKLGKLKQDTLLHKGNQSIQCVTGESEARAICFRFVERIFFYGPTRKRKNNKIGWNFSIIQPNSNIRPRSIHNSFNFQANMFERNGVFQSRILKRKKRYNRELLSPCSYFMCQIAINRQFATLIPFGELQFNSIGRENGNMHIEEKKRRINSLGYLLKWTNYQCVLMAVQPIDRISKLSLFSSNSTNIQNGWFLLLLFSFSFSFLLLVVFFSLLWFVNTQLIIMH